MADALILQPAEGDAAELPQRLAYRIALTILAVMVPVVALAGFIAWHELGAYRDEMTRSLSVRARLLSQQVDAEIPQNLAALRTLAISPALNSVDAHALYTALVGAAALNPSWLAVVLTDPQTGQHVASTLIMPPARMTTSRAAETVKEVARTGEARIAIFLPQADSIYQAPLIALLVPVARAGQVPLVLGAAVAPAVIQGLLVGEGLPEGWLSSVIDAEGTIVARTRDPGSFVGRKSSEGFWALLAGRASGMVASTTLDGRTVYTYFQRSPRTGWVTIVAVDRHLLDAIKRRSFWALFLAGGLGLLLTAAAALFVHHGTMQQRVGATRQRAQAALREREARIRDQLEELDALYSHAPVGLALLDRDLRFVRVNEALARINGAPAAEHRAGRRGIWFRR